MDELDGLRHALAGRYAVERELGRGGTATVYLARDLKLGRPVAIKVLHRSIAAALGPERFLREIEIAARLTHPHILALHDSGEAKGFVYYVMPFVEGESLRDRLNHEPQLSIAEALRISQAVAEALTYAHGHGVIHRDVKPENILLSEEAVLVADFGIARAITAAGEENLTETGIAVGTPFYMSPEQAAGERQIDGRSDVYGLGCVVYEMLAGGPPFTGPSAQAILARHALDPVPPLRTIRPELPAVVDRAVGKALAKAPADRFPNATAFSHALIQAGAPRSLARQVARPALFIAGGVAVLVAGYVLLTRQPAGGSSAEPGLSIAVLEFKNVGGDSANEPFSFGISDELTTALGKVEGLRVLARSGVVRFKGKDVSPQEIGRQLHALYVLDGGVRIGGNRRRVSAQLIDVAGGNEIWSQEYDRDAGDRDVFAVQDEITRAIVAELRVHLSGTASAALAKHSTASPEAHDLYLQGRYFFAKRDSVSMRRAQDYFRRAIQKDSSYALAWSGLSDWYSLSSVGGAAAPHDLFPQAKAAALRALALDSTLVEVHTSLGFIAVFYEWDWASAAREFDKALSIDPRYPEAHLFHAWYLLATKRIDDAVAEVQNAVKLDPFSIVNNARLASVLYYARRYDEALAQTDRLLELAPNDGEGHWERARMFLGLGRCAEALAEFERGPQANVPTMRGALGYADARCGRREQALAELTRLGAEAKQRRYMSPYPLAIVRAGLGDVNGAFADLDSAYTEHSWAMFTLRVDPMFDDLRADPRFARLLRRMGLDS